MEFPWKEIISAILQMGAASGLVMFFLQRSINKLDAIPEQLSELKSQLSRITAKLEHLEGLHVMVLEHDRKIAILEAKTRSLN